LPSSPSVRNAFYEVDDRANQKGTDTPKELKEQFKEWAKCHPIGENCVPFPPQFWNDAIVVTICAGETMLLPSGWVRCTASQLFLTKINKFHCVLSTEDTFSIAGTFPHLGLVRQLLQAVEYSYMNSAKIGQYPIYSSMSQVVQFFDQKAKGKTYFYF
jgi:hypothetical protein